MDIKNFTIRKLHEGLMKKEFSAVEVARTFFDVIEKEDKKYGAYLRLTKDAAFAVAEHVDHRIADGEEMGLLAGVPFAMKDVILMNGEIVSAGSQILSKYCASFDATVISRLRKEGAIPLGYTNCDEFAMGSSTENSSYQLTRNPHDLSRVPGGSSGGSAVAVAGGLAAFSLGSDTGGSIRQPAGFCGVVGLKPTYGAVSRFGLIPMSSSLDQIGPFANTVEDAGIVFQAIAGKDPFDATSAEHNWSNVMDFDVACLKGLTIGIPKEYFGEGIEEAVRQELDFAREKFEKFGLKFKEVSLPHTEFGVACYYIVMPAEVSANLARYDGIRYSRIAENCDQLREIYFEQRGRGFGKEVKRRILLGTFVLSHGYYDAYYAQAQKVRRLIARDFEHVFHPSSDGGVDVLFTPVSPTLPFKTGEKTNDPLQMYLADAFTIPTSLAGLPALSVPVRKYVVGSGKLPVGFQLIGPRFSEQKLLSLGRAYEDSFNQL
ncbi:MAG: Asp-tRNA(Asn)/Glu-tRNA(Gln) amidotransferase subunit GatA [Nanoarchaeota archaeon]|nr:Asp-tRNA(Asn)/Glu-tRNA(Gln) amidotransferase subunit GatA [Nanoarchaeota archaeon]